MVPDPPPLTHTSLFKGFPNYPTYPPTGHLGQTVRTPGGGGVRQVHTGSMCTVISGLLAMNRLIALLMTGAYTTRVGCNTFGIAKPAGRCWLWPLFREASRLSLEICGTLQPFGLFVAALNWFCMFCCGGLGLTIDALHSTTQRF